MERKKLFQLLCLITFLIPDNFIRQLHQKPKTFFNAWTLFSFVALCISIGHCYSEFSQVLLSKPPPTNIRPKGVTPSIQLQGDNERLESMPDSGPPIPPPEDSDSESVVHLSNVLPHLISCTIALILRIAFWISIPSIKKSKLAFVNFEDSGPTDLCLNEYIGFGLILLSLGPRHFELWCDNNGFGGVPGLRNDSLWYQLLSHLKCFIGESFPIFASGITLISFTMIITNSISRQVKLLDAKSAEVGWSIANFRTIKELNGSKNNSFPALRIEIKPIQNSTTRSSEPSIHRLISIEKHYMSCVTLWKKMQNTTALITLLLYIELTLSLSFKSFLAVSRYISTEKSNNITDAKLLAQQEGEVDWRTLNAVLNTCINVLIGLSITHSVQILHNSIEKLQFKLLRVAWSKNFTENFYLGNNLVAQQYLSYLLHTVEQNPIKLSAFGYFTVKRSTLTSLAGVILTYLVVLIQFQTT